MSTENPSRAHDNHLVLGPKSFSGLGSSSEVRGWQKTLINSQPPLYFLFDIPPTPTPNPNGSRFPGIATKYDALVIWQTHHYRIAIGRWIFDYHDDRYFIAFVYPTAATTFFSCRFGIVKVPHSSVKLSAFAIEDLPTPVAPSANTRALKFWHPIIQLLRLKAVLTMPVQTPVHLPIRVSNGPIFVEAMGTTWTVLVDTDGSLLINDVGGQLVHVNARDMTNEVSVMRNIMTRLEELDQGLVVEEGCAVDEEGNWV